MQGRRLLLDRISREFPPVVSNCLIIPTWIDGLLLSSFLSDCLLAEMFSQASAYSGQRYFQYVVLVSNSSKLSGLALASNHVLRTSPSIVPWNVNSRARDSING